MLGGEAYGVGEQGTGEEACEGEVRLGFDGRAGLGLVELADGRRAVEEGEEAGVVREDGCVVVEGHVEGDAVCDELQVVVGELSPVFPGDGVAPEETVGRRAAEAAGARVGPDREVRGAVNDEVERDTGSGLV